MRTHPSRHPLEIVMIQWPPFLERLRKTSSVREMPSLNALYCLLSGEPSKRAAYFCLYGDLRLLNKQMKQQKPVVRGKDSIYSPIGRQLPSLTVGTPQEHRRCVCPGHTASPWIRRITLSAHRRTEQPQLHCPRISRCSRSVSSQAEFLIAIVPTDLLT